MERTRIWGWIGMANSPEQMKLRTKALARRVVELVNALPPSRAADVIGKQVLRSACSVGANYRSACRGRSRAEFIAKLGIVEEEADEKSYWLELIVETKLLPEPRLRDLIAESREITAIVVASLKTAKSSVVPKRGSQSEIRNPKSEMVQ